MATNIKLRTEVVLALPTERPLEVGTVYKVKQADGELLTYTVDSSGEPVLERGITNDQKGRLEQLQQADIDKLKIDYTKAEIDSRFDDVNKGISGKVTTTQTLVQLNALSDGIYEAETEGVYANGITAKSGYTTKFEKVGTTWALFSEVKLPTVTGTNVLNPTGEDMPKEKAVANYVKPLYDLTKSGKNIVNNSDIKAGYWIVNTSGILTYISNLNYISIEITKGFEAGQPYFLQGSGNIKDMPTMDVLIFSNSNNDILGRVNGNTNPNVIPVGTTRILLNIHNAIGIGNDPTNTAFKNTLMLAKGTSSSGFVPFGPQIDGQKIDNLTASKVIDFQESVNSNLVVKSNKEAVDLLLKDYDTAYLYDGTARTNLSNTYTLSNVGDYVELVVKLKDFAVLNDGMGLLGFGSLTTTDVFGFYNSTSMWLRQSSGGSYISWTLPKSAMLDFNKIKLLVNANDKWELFFNETSLGEKDKTSTLKIDRIANAYDPTSWSKFELKTVDIKQGATTVNLKDFDLNSGSLNVNKILIPPTSDNTSYSNCYYEYSPTMFNGRKGFKVYVKKNNSNNRFIGFNIQHDLNTDPLIWVDYYRIEGAKEYSFDGTTMSDTGVVALSNGENEFTMLQKGKADHTGGWHGDEIVTDYKFMPNGVELMDLSVAIPLKSCGFFKYKVQSNLTETVNTASPTTPITGHPTIATHSKITTFEDGGFNCINTIAFKGAYEINRAYQGLICVGKAFASKGFNEIGDYSDFTSADNSNKLASNETKVFYGNGNSGSSVAKGEILAVHKASQKYVQSEYNNLQPMWVQDRVGDSKFYLCLGYNNSLSAITTQNNEKWILRSSIAYS